MPTAHIHITKHAQQVDQHGIATSKKHLKAHIKELLTKVSIANYLRDLIWVRNKQNMNIVKCPNNLRLINFMR
jgi:hypothetical protein